MPDSARWPYTNGPLFPDTNLSGTCSASSHGQLWDISSLGHLSAQGYFDTTSLGESMGDGFGDTEWCNEEIGRELILRERNDGDILQAERLVEINRHHRVRDSQHRLRKDGDLPGDGFRGYGRKNGGRWSRLGDRMVIEKSPYTWWRKMSKTGATERKRRH